MGFTDLRDSRGPGDAMVLASDYGALPIPATIARLIEEHDASGDVALGATLNAWGRGQLSRLAEMFKNGSEMKLEDDITPYLEAAKAA